MFDIQFLQSRQKHHLRQSHPTSRTHSSTYISHLTFQQYCILSGLQRTPTSVSTFFPETFKTKRHGTRSESASSWFFSVLFSDQDLYVFLHFLQLQIASRCFVQIIPHFFMKYMDKSFLIPACAKCQMQSVCPRMWT